MHSEISEHGAKDWHIAYHQQPHEKRDLGGASTKMTRSISTVTRLGSGGISHL